MKPDISKLLDKAEPIYGQYQNIVFELRQRADYDLDAEIGERQARQAIELAEAFHTATRRYFNM